MSAVACTPLAEAALRLRSPDLSERFSPLTGAGLLAVDLGSSDVRVDAGALEQARAGLLALPCPSVALDRGAVSAAGAALRAGFDVVVADEAALARLAARVRAQPLAALALVQLLRHGEGRSLEARLVGESLVYATLQGGPGFRAWLVARGAARAPEATARPRVRVHRELDRLQLRLDRPERRNAYDAAMRDALCEGLLLALHDASIREVVLSGEGPAFCAGGDLDEFGSLPDPATAHAVRSTRNAGRLIAACAPRLRALVHGDCIGAGAELPAFAGRVVARESARFELPELAMGLVPGAGGTASLPPRIGRQRTAWLALSGERIDAATALAWGLVDEIRPE